MSTDMLRRLTNRRFIIIIIIIDTFRTLNSIHPDLPETYVYPFTPVQLYRRPMTR